MFIVSPQISFAPWSGEKRNHGILIPPSQSPSCPRSSTLDGAVTSSAGQASDGGGRVGSRDAVRAAKLAEDIGVGEGEVARARVRVDLALSSEVAGAGGGGGGVVHHVGLTTVTVLVDGRDVGEDVALGKDVGTGSNLEAMAAGLVPLFWKDVMSVRWSRGVVLGSIMKAYVVVDGVEDCVAAELGCAS